MKRITFTFFCVFSIAIDLGQIQGQGSPPAQVSCLPAGRGCPFDNGRGRRRVRLGRRRWDDRGQCFARTIASHQCPGPI